MTLSTTHAVAAPAAPPIPEIRTAPTGAPVLVWDGHFLEDATDPLEGARQMVDAAVPEDARQVVLFGSGLGYRVRWLIAAGHAPIVYEPQGEIRRIAEAREPGIFDGAEVFEDVARLCERVVSATRAGEKVVLVAPPPYVRAFPERYATLQRSLAEADVLRVVRKNTAMERYRPQLAGALGNLGRLVDWPLTSAVGRPLEGKAAFIVAAGPSLDRNAHLLGALRGKGAVLVASTASPVLRTLGQRYDALLTIETVDQAESLQRGVVHADALLADLSCHAANLDVEAPRKAFFGADNPGMSDLLRRLRGIPLSYGASVPTAAVVQAWRWGADPIVLIGQDLAYTGGKVYATGTGRESFTATVRGGAVVVAHDEAFLRKFREAGIKSPPRVRPAVQAPAWGGGEVVTSHDLVLSARWFESFARALGAEIRLVNATEGGMRLEGYEHRPLAEVLDGLPDVDVALADAIDAAPRVTAADLEGLRRALRAEARAIARAARGCAEARTEKRRRRAEQTLRRASKASPLVDMYTAPELTRIFDDPSLETRPEERERRVFAAIGDAAAAVERLVGDR